MRQSPSRRFCTLGFPVHCPSRRRPPERRAHKRSSSRYRTPRPEAQPPQPNSLAASVIRTTSGHDACYAALATVTSDQWIQPPQSRQSTCPSLRTRHRPPTPGHRSPRRPRCSHGRTPRTFRPARRILGKSMPRHRRRTRTQLPSPRRTHRTHERQDGHRFRRGLPALRRVDRRRRCRGVGSRVGPV